MQQLASSRSRVLRPNQRAEPRTFNRRTQTRFLTERSAYWLERIPQPTPQQSALVETISSLEWAISVLRHENSLTSLKDLREHLRLRDRAVADLERTIKSAPAPPAPPLSEILAGIARRGARSEEDDYLARRAAADRKSRGLG